MIDKKQLEEDVRKSKNITDADKADIIPLIEYMSEYQLEDLEYIVNNDLEKDNKTKEEIEKEQYLYSKYYTKK